MKIIKLKFLSSLKRVNDLNKNKKISFLTEKKIKKNIIKFHLKKKYKIRKVNCLKKKGGRKLFIISII
ncbi:hypothetical protein ACWNX6_00725 [Candidatus Vidania fulgoroideorum]